MAEELTRSLTELADRGVPRGATEVLEAARRDAAGELRPPRRELRPAWAAAAAFAGTLAVLGGSLALGAVLREPGQDTGSPSIFDAVGDAAAAVSAGWLLIPAIAVAIALVALVVRHQQLASGKERVMATAIETTPADRLEATKRSNRWLVVTIVVLAVALVGLGAWVMYDWASEPATAPSEEITALYDDYLAAWNDRDSEAFLNLTREDYVLRSFGQTVERTAQAATIGRPSDVHVERVGDLVVMSEGTDYFVAAAERVTFQGAEYVGVSAYRVVETDEGLKIAEHDWVGNI